MPFPGPANIPGLSSNLGKAALNTGIGGSIVKGLAETVAPVGGALGTVGSIATLLTTGLFLGISEGLFPQNTAKTGLDEIDPNLLNPLDRQRFYPPSTQEVGETTNPSRTQQGYGDIVGARYEFLFEHERNIGDPDQKGGQVWIEETQIVGPLQVFEVHNNGKVGFPEVFVANHSHPWLLKGEGTKERTGEIVAFTRRTSVNAGIFTASRGKYLDMRPIGGQSEPPITNQLTSQSPPAINYEPLPPGTLAVYGSESTLNNFLNLIETGGPRGFKAKVLRNNPANFGLDISDLGGPDSPPALGGTNLSGTFGDNSRSALVPDKQLPNPLPRTTQNQASTGGTAKTSQELDPVTEVTRELVGNSVTGTEILTTTETTDKFGITTTSVTNSEGQVISLKRNIPGGVEVTNFGLSSANPAQDIQTKFGQTSSSAKTSSTLNNPSNSTKVIGTPTVTGVIETPTAGEVTQTPAIPEVAGLAVTAAAVAAAVYSESGLENITTAAAAGTCRTTSPGGCMTTNVTNPLLAGQAGLSGLFNNLANTGLAAQNAAILSVTTSTNNIVSNASHGLQAIQNFAGQAWDTLKLDKVLTVINTALLVHNAGMLSRNILGTVGEVVDNTLATIGLQIKDANGNQVGFSQVLGKSAQNLIKGIIGVENYSELTQTWTKANRIYQASVNLLSNVRSIIDSTQDIAETTGENVSLIGNALRRGGVVRENAFGWMPENLQAESRWLRRLDKIGDTADIFAEITDNTRDIAEEIKEIKGNKETFDQAISKAKDKKTEQESKDKKAAESVPSVKEEDNLFTLSKQED